MRVVNEMELKDFDFWSGAKTTASLLTEAEFDIFEAMFEEEDRMGHTPTETDINDFFWFETDFIAETLGYESYEQMFEERYKG